MLFDGEVIGVVPHGKFLGLIIDSNLNFNDHIIHICKKVSKSVGIFHKLGCDLPQYVLINLYYAFVYPYLLYCNIVWGGTYSACLSPLRVLQKRIVRLIAGAHYVAHTDPLFFRLRILKLDDLYRYSLALYMYRHRQSFAQLHTDSYLIRNRESIAPQYQRLSVAQRSVYYMGPRVWNSLPEHIRNVQRLSGFKREVKKYFIGSYSQD